MKILTKPVAISIIDKLPTDTPVIVTSSSTPAPLWLGPHIKVLVNQAKVFKISVYTNGTLVLVNRSSRVSEVYKALKTAAKPSGVKVVAL